MIIRREQPLANDHPKGSASCKWSSRGTNLLQMIIWMDRPLANDHQEGLAYCKWSSGGSGLLQMIIRHLHHPSHLCQDPESISQTFLVQFVFVHIAILYNFPCWSFSDFTIDNHEDVLLLFAHVSNVQDVCLKISGSVPSICSESLFPFSINSNNLFSCAASAFPHDLLLPFYNNSISQ